MKKKQSKRAASSRKGDSDALADMIAPMRGLVEQQKKIFVERHEYRDATAADFKGRDRKWYDGTERELAGLGYRPLGDMVDETVARMGLRVVIRRLVSEDSTNAAAVYQFVQGSGFMKIDLRVCDVETELSDGSFLTTSNSEASAAASLPKQIRSTKYPAGTPIAELVARHDEAKRELLAGRRGAKLRATEIRTAADYDAMQHRQEAIKAAFRQGIGYLDPAEVRRIAEQRAPDEPIFAGVAAATADVARRQAQMERDNPAAAGLMGMLFGGGEKKSPADLAKIAMGAVLQQQPDVPADKRDKIAATMTNLLSSADSGDENAGMKSLFALMAQLQELEPKEQKEAKRQDFEKAMARAAAEHERRQAAHVKKRLAKGLSEKAGTGKPEPEILIHGLPVADLDYKDKPRRSLDAMIEELKASKDRRDAKTLARLPLGHSRVGGLPDLPPDRPWPTHKGKRIPFVAQLNLAEFPKDAHPLLPERGHLYAFALISNDKKHWPPPVSVFLYDGQSRSLVRTTFPGDDEIWPDWGGERVYEVLPATAKPKGRDPRKRSREFGETLGWLQGSMDEVFGTPGEIADDRFEDGNDWINLLAIESEGSMQWSDAGHLYLLIRRSALKKRDFSNVLAAACSS
ncbi:MAG TPA: DUF1963 domain-containing protein [Tepidisphaeraceae bacterium]|nr:DUF1963 domain-containing protein [Tepidisphaeraceae bacterium]